LAHDLGDDFRVCIRGLLGRAVPGDVRFDDNDILPRDKALDAAEIGKGALDEGARSPPCTTVRCGNRVSADVR